VLEQKGLFCANNNNSNSNKNKGLRKKNYFRLNLMIIVIEQNRIIFFWFLHFKIESAKTIFNVHDGFEKLN